MRVAGAVALVALLLGLNSWSCAAQEITVAAAADLQFVMQDVSARFQKETGKSIKLILRLVRKLLPADPERRSF
jgi:ABC-type molybdate transport system substrate-binding protein